MQINGKQKLIAQNITVIENNNKFIIKEDLSGSINTIIGFLLVSDLGSIFPLFILLYFGDILVFAVWVVSIISMNLILIKLYDYYKNYKKSWIYDKSSNKMLYIRKSSKFKKEIWLKFENIKYLTYSHNTLSKIGGFYLSVISIDDKKFEMVRGRKNYIEKLGKSLAKFLQKPLIRRDFYKAEIILFSICSFIFLLILYFFFLYISEKLIQIGFTFIIGLSLLFLFSYFVLIIIISISLYFKQRKRLKRKSHINK
ncbi:MAG: hypothetical protein ACFFAH_01465 [Promethearchaeota archaeon]